MTAVKGVQRAAGNGLSQAKDWFGASQLAAIVENCDEAVIATDLAGVIVTWNAAAERIFGHAPAKAIGQSIFGLVPARLREQERHLRERLQNAVGPVRLETVRLARDGREIPVCIR